MKAGLTMRRCIRGKMAGLLVIIMLILVSAPVSGCVSAPKTPFLTPVETKTPVFSVVYLPLDYKKAMEGLSWKKGCPVSRDNLRLVKTGYIGFDGRIMQGELVVHKTVALEVLEIFKELYAAGYPIRNVSLVDNYNADDTKSMEADNTSAFNYRKIEGSTSLSKHSYGIAIDINPIENPYIKGKTLSPAAGKDFTNRTLPRLGMIVAGDPCHKAFTSRGWTWGGNWKTLKDYQHFEKPLKVSTLK